MDQVAVLLAGGEEKIRDPRDQNLWEVIEVIEYIQNSPGFCQEERFCLRHDKSLFPPKLGVKICYFRLVSYAIPSYHPPNCKKK